MKNSIALLFVIATLLGGLFTGMELFPKTVYIEKPAGKIIEKISASPPEARSSEAAIKVPAVDTNGKGVASRLRVIAMPGKGRILTDINSVLFFTDTQSSIRISKKVAENATGMDLRSYDIIYIMETNASFIEGPSAGAALTIATIAALQDREVRQDVMITGSMNEDGTIGLAGGIEEKAKAAKAAGARLFVVPSEYYLQQAGHEKKFECREMDGMEYCETSYVIKEADLTAKLGIDIAKASNIKEAMGYFLE